jgi:hypothetical protein
MTFFETLTKEDYLEKYKDSTKSKVRSKINELLDDGCSQESIEEFIDIFGEDQIEGFHDSYCGNHYSGAEYAKQFVNDCWYEVFDRMPGFMEIDWVKTWNNLTDDYTITDKGNVFNKNF